MIMRYMFQIFFIQAREKALFTTAILRNPLKNHESVTGLNPHQKHGFLGRWPNIALNLTEIC